MPTTSSKFPEPTQYFFPCRQKHFWARNQALGLDDIIEVTSFSFLFVFWISSYPQFLTSFTSKCPYSFIVFPSSSLLPNFWTSPEIFFFFNFNSWLFALWRQKVQNCYCPPSCCSDSFISEPLSLNGSVATTWWWISDFKQTKTHIHW